MGFAAPAAIALGAGIGGSIYQGQESMRVQKQALRQQDAAQQMALAAAQAQQRRANEANRRATAKQPDVAGILSAAQKPAKPATMLTGAQGVDPADLTLGRTTLLGM